MARPGPAGNDGACVFLHGWRSREHLRDWLLGGGVKSAQAVRSPRLDWQKVDPWTVNPQAHACFKFARPYVQNRHAVRNSPLKLHRNSMETSSKPLETASARLVLDSTTTMHIAKLEYETHAEKPRYSTRSERRLKWDFARSLSIFCRESRMKQWNPQGQDLV